MRTTFLVGLLSLAFFSAPAIAAGDNKHPHPPHHGWSFDGPFGIFDTAQVQRGFKVYKEVCAACHSMELLHFRNLGEKDGPFHDSQYSNANDNPVIRLLASEHMVPDIDGETGDEIERPALPSDTFPLPFPNDAAARASNGGALPPDLSVISKARHGGASYIYSLLTGYPGEGGGDLGLTVVAGQYYNPYFPGDSSANWSGDPRHTPPGGMLAMAPPLFEDMVEYDDGSAATVEQMAEDVAAFLAWSADPKQTERKRLGTAVMIYLLLLSGLAYASYRRLWRNIH